MPQSTSTLGAKRVSQTSSVTHLSRLGDRGWDSWMISSTWWENFLRKFWEIAKDREAWHAAVHGVTKSQTQLSDWTTTTYCPLVLAIKAQGGFFSIGLGQFPQSKPVKMDKPMSIQPSHPMSSLFPSAFNLCQHRALSNESALCIRWPKFWSFSFSISPSSEYSELISFRINVWPLFLAHVIWEPVLLALTSNCRHSLLSYSCLITCLKPSFFVTWAVEWTSTLFSSPLVVQLVENPPAMWETSVRSLDWEDPLEKGKATHSSILAWRISQTVYPWDLYSRKESDMTAWLSVVSSHHHNRHSVSIG